MPTNTCGGRRCPIPLSRQKASFDPGPLPHTRSQPGCPSRGQRVSCSVSTRAARCRRPGQFPAPRGARSPEPGLGACGPARGPVEDDSLAETYGEENDEQERVSKRKITGSRIGTLKRRSILKLEDHEGGRCQCSQLCSSLPQFLFAEVQKERGGESSCPKQNSAFYVGSESPAQDLQELPLSHSDSALLLNWPRLPSFGKTEEKL